MIGKQLEKQAEEQLARKQSSANVTRGQIGEVRWDRWDEIDEVSDV